MIILMHTGGKMAKKQAQFRFDENLYIDIIEIAKKEEITVSEIVRNAIKLYIAVYERTKGNKGKLFIETDNLKNERCELVLPWLL